VDLRPQLRAAVSAQLIQPRRSECPELNVVFVDEVNGRSGQVGVRLVYVDVEFREPLGIGFREKLGRRCIRGHGGNRRFLRPGKWPQQAQEYRPAHRSLSLDRS